MSAVTQQNLLLTGKLTLKTSCTHTSQFFFCCAAGVIAGDGGVPRVPSRVLLCQIAFAALFFFLSLSHIHLTWGELARHVRSKSGAIDVEFRFKLLVENEF
jgi:hypothetical protein